MELTQLAIDFSAPLVHFENNSESQKHFEKNAEKFSDQCKAVYSALKAKPCTVYELTVSHGIGDPRRRIKDLKDIFKVNVQDRWVKSEETTRHKEYFIA